MIVTGMGFVTIQNASVRLGIKVVHASYNNHAQINAVVMDVASWTNVNAKLVTWELIVAKRINNYWQKLKQMENAWVIVVAKANADWGNVFVFHHSKARIVPFLLIMNALVVPRKQNAVEKVYASTTNVSVCLGTLAKIVHKQLNVQKIARVMVYVKMVGAIVVLHSVDSIVMLPMPALMDVLKGVYA